MGRALLWMETALHGQRGALFPWAPVCMACGIGVFFAMPVEPPVWQLWGAAALGGLGLALARWAGFGVAVLLMALGLMVFGFALAGARTHRLAAPVLDFRYYGPIEGRVIGMDRSASDAVRLTLDRVVLERMDPQETPARVRVSLHGGAGAEIRPGMTALLTGHLSPPSGAVEPGGFDFRRHAWFLQLGAVGYTRVPVMALAPPGEGLRVFAARMWLSERVRDLLPGERGAFAAAIMSGDRSAMSQQTLADLRNTNLAHLLAISGLHMGLLAGVVFTALRLGLLLVPRLRHSWPVKKLAAGGALLAAAGYLALSGGNVATERAFVMAAVALVAVMLDRRALSLRSVALAALVILSLQPEALTGPGFQMSFAATTALVAVYERISLWRRGRDLPRWLMPVAGVVISSSVAGLATAPVGMAHFNTAASYGLIANLVAVPVMGLVVMPLGVVAALLMPLGLDWLPLAGMGLGLGWILAVAETVAGWPGAVRPVVAPGPWVLPLMALGGLLLCLWRGRGRLAGLAPMALALWLWSGAERPALLIADSGALVGVMTPEGRGLSRDSGAGFVAEVWLENDGAGRDQVAAATLWPGPREGRLAQVKLAGAEIFHAQGKRAQEGLICGGGGIVVASEPYVGGGDCRVFDPERLRATGAVAAWVMAEGLRWRQANPPGHWRLWWGGTRPQ